MLQLLLVLFWPVGVKMNSLPSVLVDAD